MSEEQPVDTLFFPKIFVILYAICLCLMIAMTAMSGLWAPMAFQCLAFIFNALRGWYIFKKPPNESNFYLNSTLFFGFSAISFLFLDENVLGLFLVIMAMINLHKWK